MATRRKLNGDDIFEIPIILSRKQISDTCGLADYGEYPAKGEYLSDAECARFMQHLRETILDRETYESYTPVYRNFMSRVARLRTGDIPGADEPLESVPKRIIRFSIGD